MRVETVLNCAGSSMKDLGAFLIAVTGIAIQLSVALMVRFMFMVIIVVGVIQIDDI